MIFNTASFNAVMLVSVRIGIVLFFTPIQALRQLPIHCRFFLVIGLSATIVYALSLHVDATTDLPLLVLIEGFNGLCIALPLMALFAILSIAGQIAETQMGLNALALFNPAEHSHDPLTARFFNLLGTLFFLGLNGHLWLIQGLSQSLLSALPGELLYKGNFIALTHHIGMMFSLGLMLAGPVWACLFLVDVSAALLTRNMPQISTYFFTLPIKIVLGLLLLISTLNYFQPFYEHLMMNLMAAEEGVLS